MKWCRSQAEVVDRFLKGLDGRSGTGNLLSKIYDGVRILQHYRVVEAVKGEGVVVRNTECWNRGFSSCPIIPDDQVRKVFAPITGLVGIFGVRLDAIARIKKIRCPSESLERHLTDFRWYEVEGRLYGYDYHNTELNVLIDYDAGLSYIYRVEKWTNRGYEVAFLPPEFDVKVVKKMATTDYVRKLKRGSLRDRLIDNIKALQDLRALMQIAPVVVNIDDRLFRFPVVRVGDGKIIIETPSNVIFRVEGYHLLGNRGSVAKVVALGTGDDDGIVRGVWLVGRDVTGQLWRTVFDESFYRYSFWTLERYALNLDPEDVIVEES
jgi:hypothetical protein